MIIDVDPRDLPFAIHEGRRWQRAERGLIEALKELAPTHAIHAHDPAVQIVDELGDPGVECLEGKECLMT